MGRIIRFVVLLIAGLAILTWVAYATLTRTSRQWFEHDIDLRSRLAVDIARSALLTQWSNEDSAGLRGTLAEITLDERIMAAAACGRGEQLAATELFPQEYTCAQVAQLRREQASRANGPVAAWTSQLPGGAVRVTAVSLGGEPHEVGFIVLLHDLSFADRRERTTRNQMLLAFGIFAFCSVVITLLAARLAWREWLTSLRRGLAMGSVSREFQPLMHDVRELVERLRQEEDREVKSGRWSPERLRSVLSQYLQGERVVIVANREPYIHERDEQGIKIVHPASGLVSALEPVMRACSGVWVAHGAGSADRECSDARGHVKVPPGEESYALRRVWLSADEEAGYYFGFANEGLWPLCHIAHTRPFFRAQDWQQYRRVNQRFAEAACEEVDSDDPIIWVQDYHFALAPRMIRERLPRATVITFWHIPWPNAERFGICPYRDQLLDGLLGSSILGFHTRKHCNNFMDSVDSFLESRIDRERNSVEMQSQRTLIRPYPISIEWPVSWIGELPGVGECRRRVFEELRLEPSRVLGVGVDRLDYTKGIEERLMAVDSMLERYPEFRGRFVFAQLAAPSRTRIERYRELNDRIEQLAETINSRWATDSYRPIVLLRSHHDRLRVFQYFRAADLCYVSSLHDGMNIVAKEFVAARDDERGVLILSQFTGAARELTEALIVNPYDVQLAADAMALALRMLPSEQQARMRAMRTLLSELNVYRWAGRMLVDAAQLRRRLRLSGRLSRAADVTGTDWV